MAQGGQEQPSMEEILASIRRIIAEDESDKVERPEVPATQPAEEEVLELTDRVQDPDRVERFGQAKKPGTALAKLRQVGPAPSGEKASEDPGREIAEAGGLLSDQAAAAAVAALSQAVQADGSTSPSAGAGDGQTLDELVRQALTPLLKAWLDENLPPLVERIVREEVRRLAQQVRR